MNFFLNALFLSATSSFLTLLLHNIRNMPIHYTKRVIIDLLIYCHWLFHTAGASLRSKYSWLNSLERLYRKTTFVRKSGKCPLVSYSLTPSINRSRKNRRFILVCSSTILTFLCELRYDIFLFYVFIHALNQGCPTHGLKQVSNSPRTECFLKDRQDKLFVYANLGQIEDNLCKFMVNL